MRLDHRISFSAAASSCSAALAALCCLGSRAQAGGTPENVLLIIDPSNAESLYLGNDYKHARNIPDANVLYMVPTPASYSQFSGATLDAFFGALENAHISDHIDYVVLAPGGPFYVSANGLVSDPCSTVQRFSATAPYALAFSKAQILAGTTYSTPNGYYRSDDDARAFDSSLGWLSGLASTSPAAKHYFIAAMLGYSGAGGNTLAEVLAMIDRSVAVDGTHPTGTFYFMQTSDFARSSPRDPCYPAAVNSIIALGGSAQHLFADLPLGQHDCLGIMTGLAAPDIDNADLGIVPGAFCDHLTSYAATFDETSQTKMSRWIKKGASGTSGAVEEPCNYPGKFPTARLHVYYDKGLSLGEAWFRSLRYAPFQTLFTGDPLTRPFAHLPSVTLSGVPAAAVSNTLVLVPDATTTHPSAGIAGFELLVDGRSYAQIAYGGQFALDTTAFDDGWHELRVLAYDDTLIKSVGRVVTSLAIDNHARSATLGATPASGNLSQRFDFNAAGSGGTVAQLRLMQGTRVLAASATSPATLSVYGRTLGAGLARVQLVAEFTDGRTARSAPLEIDVSFLSGSPVAAAPVAFSYTKHVLAAPTFVVELASTFADEFASATWAVLSTPAQSTITGGSGPYRILTPSASAAGTDTLTFRVDTPSGSSSVATVTLVYDAPAPCPAPQNYCTSTPNSTGTSGAISWSGSTSFGANNLTLSAYNLPADGVGLFVYGQSPNQIPLGNGFLCISSPVMRLGVLSTSFAGDVSFDVDLGAYPFVSGAGAITTGSTWRFQFWYRDPAAGGANFNLTDALAVTFCF